MWASQLLDAAVDDAALPAAVLDTNVLLDWLVFKEPGVLPLVNALSDGRLRWLATPAMRDELRHMLTHASLSKWGPHPEQALTTFDRLAQIHPTAAACRLRCTDADDQGFIDLAVAHRAAWLLTRDRALLKLKRRALGLGVHIATPESWVAGPTSA